MTELEQQIKLPRPGPASSRREREKYMKEMQIARRVRIPEQIYRSLQDSGVWISPTLDEDTPRTSFGRKGKPALYKQRTRR